MILIFFHRDHSASASFYKKQVRMSTLGSKPASDLSDLDLFQDLPPSVNDSVDSKDNPTRHYQELGPFSQTKEWMLYQNPPKENEMRLRVQQVCCFEFLFMSRTLLFNNYTLLFIFLVFSSV